jgi:hypothetical protein
MPEVAGGKKPNPKVQSDLILPKTWHGYLVFEGKQR